ncbi:hypothetical protein ACFE33_14010 [Falsihalocynthiibacter sp. SS001]|uniref:hypothetical protein n=1 Tax=Falsihalocynthiibacter sp. SS001 TaxID=3349698 RepID=UPI0036D38881
MDTDLFLVIGVVILILTIPPVLGAIFDGRALRTPAILIVIAGSMITFAITQRPGGYDIHDVPVAFSNVIGKYF